LVKFGPQTAEI